MICLDRSSSSTISSIWRPEHTCGACNNLSAPEACNTAVEDSLSGSREATMAYPMESILEDISPEAAKINVPTVLLAGELDQVDSIERHKAEVLAYIPNAQFKIIEGSGHLIPIDEPVQLAKEIASFMSQLTA
jgi:pimeloyl-ACP methyl ester carboxylesterase